MSEGETRDHAYKILLLGDSSVGKTCFLKRYTDDTFQDAYLSTIGFDFKFKNVTLKSGKEVRVQLWDTAGQERFRTIAKSYYKGAHGIILLYDVTHQKSFDSMKKWLTQIKEEAPSKTCIILIANKIDCVEERVVSKEDGEALAKNYNLKIFESSAKENINVSEAFQEVIETIVKNHTNTSSTNGTKLNTQNQNQSNKNNGKGCC